MKTKVKGKALAILMSLAMVFTMMPMMGVAAYATDVMEGDGTANNPYKISNYDELKEFADIVNGTHETIQQDTGACAKLTNDIECNDEKWVPMATWAKPYTGTFYGNNKTIKKLSNKESEGAASADLQGLFGVIDSEGTVKDVGLVNVYIHGYMYIGGVAGWNNGTISNCYSTGDVSGAGEVGGVAGINGGTITNCYNTGDVSGNGGAGGVAGSNGGTITNCYNTGKVSGSGISVGGVAGSNGLDGTITNCYNTGDVSGERNVGGVAGYNEGVTITNCYNTGDVSGKRNVGGVAGENHHIITNCYNTGDVSGERNVGGVAGENRGGAITNCYYDSDKSGVSSAIGYSDDTDTVKGLGTGLMTGEYALNNMKFKYIDGETSPWMVKATDANAIYYPHLKGFNLNEEGGQIAAENISPYDWPARIEKIVAPPTFSPEAGEFGPNQKIKISCASKGATIYYTTDGTDPTTSGNKYTEPIVITDTITIKAMAVKEGIDDSEIAEATYTHVHKYGAWTKLDASQHHRVCEHDKTHVEKANHTWDAGKVTKPATTTTTGVKTYTCTACKATKTETIAKLPEQKDPDDPKKDDPEKDDPEKQYGTDGTPVGPGASIEAAEKAITNTTSDKDIKGATFAPLKFKSSSQGKTNIKLSWTKNKKAAKYVVYGNLCNAGSKKYKPVKLATVKGKTYNVKKIKTAKVKKGTYYKFVIVALNKNNKVVSTSKTIHVATKGGKVGNHKGVTVKAKVNAKGKAIKKAKPLSKTVLKKGRSLKLTVKMNPAAKKQKVKKHVGLRYETTNAKVATVSGSKIKAKGKGKCIVYAYTQNGVAKAIKITVK